MKTCPELTRAGKPCGRPIGEEDEFCLSHLSGVRAACKLKLEELAREDAQLSACRERIRELRSMAADAQDEYDRLRYVVEAAKQDIANAIAEADRIRSCTLLAEMESQAEKCIAEAAHIALEHPEQFERALAMSEVAKEMRLQSLAKRQREKDEAKKPAADNRGGRRGIFDDE